MKGPESRIGKGECLESDNPVGGWFCEKLPDSVSVALTLMHPGNFRLGPMFQFKISEHPCIARVQV